MLSYPPLWGFVHFQIWQASNEVGAPNSQYRRALGWGVSGTVLRILCFVENANLVYAL